MAFPDEDMAGSEREPHSRMARRRRGRPSVKSQSLGARGRGRYSLSSCVVSLGACDHCACPGADLHRGGGEQMPKPYPCLPVQRTLKLPLCSKIRFRNPHSPWRAPAAQHPVPGGMDPSPMVSPPQPLPFPSPPPPTRACPQPTPFLAGWRKAPSASSSAYSRLSCAQIFTRPHPRATDLTWMENPEKDRRRKECRGAEVSPLKSSHCPQDTAC